MACDSVEKALVQFKECTETTSGARIRTMCLYPSFSNVDVYVVKVGDEFHVHDCGDARGTAQLHGRDSGLADRYLRAEALRFGLSYEKGQLIVRTVSQEWLSAAIMAVANAAAFGVEKAVEHAVRAAEESLHVRIRDRLRTFVSKASISEEVEYVGDSGKRHRFDFAIKGQDDHISLIDAVSPHHASIAAKYVAFADLRSRENTDRLAVHDAPLDAEDKALMQQVADVVAFEGMSPRVLRVSGL